MTLEKACKKLLVTNPFYGLFLLGVNKRYSDEVDTACVYVNGINVEMLVNQQFLESLSPEAAVDLITHETMHIVFKHVFGIFNEKMPIHEIANAAMDLEINSMLPDIKKHFGTTGGCFIEDFGFPARQGSVWYYNEIMKKFPKLQQMTFTLVAGDEENADIKLPGTLDDHSKFGEDEKKNKLSEAQRKLVSDQIDAQAKRAAEEVIKSRGSVPGEVAEYIKGLLHPKPPVYNWRQAFRRVVGNSITSDLLLTKMRPSKRFPDARGIRVKRKPEILVGVDTSGSVSPKDAQDFFNEIYHIWKTGIKVTVAECDTRITTVFEYKGKLDEINWTGRGGTILSPLVQYYKEHKNFSSMVLFTDGYCETDLSAKNLIWVITRNGNQSQKFNGIQINMPQE